MNKTFKRYKCIDIGYHTDCLTLNKVYYEFENTEFYDKGLIYIRDDQGNMRWYPDYLFVRSKDDVQTENQKQ